MTNNNQSNPLDRITFVQDLAPESAAAISGGAVTSTDVSLFSETSAGGQYRFGSNKGVENLQDFGFNDTTAFIAVNNDKTWRFYEHANFQGDFVDVGPDTARLAGDFGMKISSFKSIS